MEISRENLKAEADNLRKQAEPIWGALEGHEQHRRAFESSLRHFEEQRLCITVMGEFNTGKSTLLNAFIGEERLPTDQLECTAVPTWVRWADNEDFDENRQAVVIYENGESDAMALSQVSVHTTLDQDSWEAIEWVEITLPQPIDGEGRPTGLVLVDTPGLNGNERLEARSIHQLGMSHVAIVVVPVDGIGRRSDAELIKKARSIADRVMVVINKCDQYAKMGDGFEKFKEDLRRRIPALSYEDIYALSAKRELDGAGYQEGEEELENEIHRFSADLKNALENPASALRRRPVALLREICNVELARIKEVDAESDADASKEVEVAKAQLEEAKMNLERSQEEILRLARKTIMGELDGLQSFLVEMQPVVEREVGTFVDGLEAALLEQDDLDAARKKVSEWLGERIKKPIFDRMSRLLTASARRLIFDLEQRGVSKVNALDLPKIAPLRLDTAALEQQADSASKALRRRQDEIEGLKQDVEKCKGAVKRQKAKANALGKQCAQLKALEKERKKAVANRKGLGPKPEPKVEYCTVSETREVKRGGLARILDIFHTKKKEVKVQRQHRDYSDVEKWERKSKAKTKKIADLDKKMTHLKKMPEEMRKIQGELRKLQREADKAQERLRSAKRHLDRERERYRKSGLETRRAKLKESTRRELERIFDALPGAFGQEAEQVLEGISREFSERFKEAADQQQKSLADEMERRQKLARAEDAERTKREAARKTLDKALDTFLSEDQGERT